MLGVENGVALGEPLGGAPVQCAPAPLQQGVVDRVPDQCVREQKGLALLPNQSVGYQGLGCVVRAVEDEAQHVGLEALAEHGRRLQGLLVGDIESIRARLDEALHRARHAHRPCVLLGVTQELF